MPITVKELGQEFHLVPVGETTQVLTGMNAQLTPDGPMEKVLFVTVIPLPVQEVTGRFAAGFFLEQAALLVTAPLDQVWPRVRFQREADQVRLGIPMTASGFDTDFYWALPARLPGEGYSEQQQNLAYLNLGRLLLKSLLQHIDQNAKGAG